MEPFVRLRWKICKALGRPLNDPMFKNMLPVQWLTYAALLRKDEEESYEKNRDLLEYLARFWNNDAVDKIQIARAQTKESSDDGFSKMLEKQFGRGLGSAVQQDLTVQQLGDQIKRAAQ